MKFHYVLVLGLLVIFAKFCNGMEFTEENGVAVLNSKNFNQFLSNNNQVLVMFYTSWCGHSKKFAPDFAKAATILKNNENPVYLAKVRSFL